MDNKEMTLGQQRVRASFNPSEDPKVTEIKQKTAELIDLMELMKDKDPELTAIAQRSYETAAMWAVKLATTPIDAVHKGGL